MNLQFVVLDFEFYEVAPGKVNVVCVVAYDINTGLVYKAWLEGEAPSSPLFPCSSETILVAHAVAPAEARCLRELGWPTPGGWIDTYVEARVLASGEKPEEGFGLLACCHRYQIKSVSSDYKKSMRELILKGGPRTNSEKLEILDYCESDVREGVALFQKLRPTMNINQAIIRGDSMAAFADIGDRGLPVDLRRFSVIQKLGNHGLRLLWQEHLDEYQLMDNGRFSYQRFAALVEKSGLCWPRTDSGLFKKDKDTLKEFSKTHGDPWNSVYELTRSIAGGSVDRLNLGGDGRIYAAPKPFLTLSGRSAPSTSEFLFLGPKWLRSLLQPKPGKSLIEFDWSNQEYAIAAALSQDSAMMSAYDSGDPYLNFAKAANAVPPDATKTTHPKEREIYKIVSLAVLMGMSERSIGRNTGTGTCGGIHLLSMHKQAFPDFWKWSDSVASTGAASRDIETAFGLVYNPRDPKHYKPRTARNFLLQATGSDMLRVAVLLLAAARIEVIATIHDAVIVECDTAEAGIITRRVKAIMEDASRIVLWERLTVRVDCERTDYPNHVKDAKGIRTWSKLAPLLGLPLDNNHG